MNRSTEGAAGATTALTVAMGISFLLGYVLNVALLWLLSPGEIGIYGVIIALMNLLSLVIVGGIPWSVAKILSEETSAVNWARAFKSAVVFNLLVALGICLGFVLTVVFVVDLSKTYLISVPFVVLTLLILAIRLPYERALQGFFRFNQLAVMQVLLIVFRAVFVIVLVLVGFGVPGVLSGMTLASFLSVLIVAFWLRDFRYWKTPGWLNIRVLTFALPMFIWFAGMNILQNSDLLGVKLFVSDDTSDETTGYYQSAVTIARAPFFLAMAFSTSLFPFISKKMDVGNQTYGHLALKYTFFLIVPLSLIGALDPSALLNFLFPVEYQQASTVLAVISCATLMQVLAQVMGTVFQAKGRPVTTAVSWAGAASIQVLLILPFTRLWGMEGAAISSLVASSVLVSVLMFHYSKAFQLRFSWMWIVKVTLVAIISGSILLLFPTSSRILFVGDLVVSGVVYLVLLLIFNLLTSRDIDILGAGLPKHRFSETLIHVAKDISSFFVTKGDTVVTSDLSQGIGTSIGSAQIPLRYKTLGLLDPDSRLFNSLSRNRMARHILVKSVNQSLFVLFSIMITLGVIVGLPGLWDWTFGPVLVVAPWLVVASLLYRWASDLAFAIAIVLLGLVAGLLIMNGGNLADDVGIAAFYYLLLGISLAFLRLILRG